jgi:hypothetical protein
MTEMQAVAGAVPPLAGAAARRAEAALAAKRPPAAFDVAVARTEFARLMHGVWQPAEAWS